MLANLAKVHEGAALKTLCFLIAGLVDYLSLGKTMGDTQVVETAKMILLDVETKNLKPDDIKICFDGVKRGLYVENGKLYDRIDGQIIFCALRAYIAERQDYIESKNIQQHANVVKKPFTAHPKLVEVYREAQKLAEQKEAEPVKKPEGKKVREKTEREKLIQSLFLEFDQIHEKKPHRDVNKETGHETPGRYIMYNGKMVDQVDYVEIKLKEAGV